MVSQLGVFQQAMAFHQAGHLAQAEALYRQILQTEPNHPDALRYLGVLAHQVGKSEIAVELISKALSCRPDYVEAYTDLGIALKAQGKLDEAIESFRRALTLKPDLAVLHYNLGVALDTKGDLQGAVASFHQALTMKPDSAEAHSNLGVTLREQGKLDEAVASFCQALTLKPDLIDAHNNLGLTLQEQGKLDAAIASFRQALTLKPDFSEACCSLGNILKDTGQLDEAIASLQRALTLKPDYAIAHSSLLFCMNYLPGQSTSQYLEEARNYGRQAAAKVKMRFSDWICSKYPERLRIGMVSGDFRNHPIGYFLENMLSNIDPEKIDLIAYPTNRKEDDLTARIRSRFVDWKPLAGMDDATAALLIHDDGVHILLDLSGHTRFNRLPIFAWKPAPVQAAWLGYFASTGLEEMDYIIADPVSVPEACREDFTEKVWYLPDTRVCFSPPVTEDDLPPTPLPALHNGYITFGSFQNLAKLNDEVLAAWGRILQALPGARLRLQTPQLNSSVIREQMLGRCAKNGITTDRVTLEKPAARTDYLASHAHIDIILDTFPFPGYTTTCEALWMGVPTVTLAGETMVGRQGESLLTCAGLSDWIAMDVEGYVAKALAHAADPEKLARLRANLRRQVLASPLFDGPGFARNFEAAMWGMWKAWNQKS